MYMHHVTGGHSNAVPLGMFGAIYVPRTLSDTPAMWFNLHPIHCLNHSIRNDLNRYWTGIDIDLIIHRAPSQYPKRRLFVRSRKVSKPRDLYLELFDRSDIWQALRQHCCRCACQISKRYDNLKYQSRGFETSRDLTQRRLFGYWDGAQIADILETWR